MRLGLRLKKFSNYEKLFILFILIGILSSYSKFPKFWGENKNIGIINNSVRIDCKPKIAQENYVITSDSAYQETFGTTMTGQTDCELPSIDFNTQSLLGVKVIGTCKIKVIREVTSIDKESKYRYNVKVRSCGMCKKMAYIDNWVTVPKLPNGWTVDFEVVEK